MLICHGPLIPFTRSGRNRKEGSRARIEQLTREEGEEEEEEGTGSTWIQVENDNVRISLGLSLTCHPPAQAWTNIREKKNMCLISMDGEEA